MKLAKRPTVTGTLLTQIRSQFPAGSAGDKHFQTLLKNHKWIAHLDKLEKQRIELARLKEQYLKKNMKKNSASEKRIQEWWEARVQHYITSRSPESLARMLVELEDASNNIPEFKIDEPWPP